MKVKVSLRPLGNAEAYPDRSQVGTFTEMRARTHATPASVRGVHANG
jgi:hypothetical protein